MRGDNDNPTRAEGGPFRPSPLALFLPAIVILCGYSALLGILIASGKGETALARLCMLILALGSPFLIAHALLRQLTTKIDLLADAVLVHPGFPATGPLEIPYAAMDGMAVLRGVSGRLTDSGTLVFRLKDGVEISAPAIRAPDAALSAIRAAAALAVAEEIDAEADGADGPMAALGHA